MQRRSDGGGRGGREGVLTRIRSQDHGRVVKYWF